MGDVDNTLLPRMLAKKFIELYETGGSDVAEREIRTLRRIHKVNVEDVRNFLQFYKNKRLSAKGTNESQE